MNQSEALRLIIEALQGIQEALEEQNKLLSDMISYPINGGRPRLVAEITGAIETMEV